MHYADACAESITDPAVSRITANSQNLGMHISLDLANELYPLQAGESFTLALARSLVPEQDAADALAAGAAGSQDQDDIGAMNGDGVAPKPVRRELWRSGDQGLAADYDYVMFGKVSVQAL